MNTLLEDEVETLNTTDKGWKIVIFNDDYTPYDVVVLALQMVLTLSDEIAEMVCKEAHSSGSAVAKSNLEEEQANLMVEKIVSITKFGGRFPGIKCEAQKDE